MYYRMGQGTCLTCLNSTEFAQTKWGPRQLTFNLRSALSLGAR